MLLIAAFGRPVARSSNGTIMRFLAGTDYVSDDGAGWLILYLAGGLPLGIIFLTTSTWGPLVGLVLITYWWWPSWWMVARRAVKSATPPLTPKEVAAAQAGRLAQTEAPGGSERGAGPAHAMRIEAGDDAAADRAGGSAYDAGQPGSARPSTVPVEDRSTCEFPRPDRCAAHCPHQLP